MNYNGKNVIFNAVIVKWGDESWEQNRIDLSCNDLAHDFPEFPPNTNREPAPNGCFYNGEEWGRINVSGHVVAMDTSGPNPYVTFKLHKEYGGDGDYMPYYVVLDTWPPGPAIAMGVPAVPKYRFLADVAVPLVQFMPPAPLHPTYPPMPSDGNGLAGGGPFGGQSGLPSYFMPEDDYSPMWHIGFAHWKQPATEVVKGFKQLKQLRAEGKLEIVELDPVANLGTDNFNFDNLNSPHVVNCPTPITVDRVIHDISLKSRGLPTE